MVDARKYRIAVQRRETEDGLLFEGTVHDLPDVAVYGDSFDEAYELAIDAIEGLYELATEQGRSFPPPSKRDTEYSGKFVTRIPKWLHRDLAVAAADEGASLNSYVLSVLSAHKSRGNVVIQYSVESYTPVLAEPAVVSSGSAAKIIGLGTHLRDFDLSGDFRAVPTVEQETSASDLYFISADRRISGAAKISQS